MAQSKSKSTRRSGRGALRTASAPLARRSQASAALPRDVSPPRRSQNLRSRYEVPPLVLPVDRRYFDPEPEATRPAKRLSGRPARVVAPPPAKRAVAPAGRPAKLLSPSTLLFARSAGVAVCVQRGVRREVLHAKGVAGQSGLNPPRRGPYSGVRCA